MSNRPLVVLAALALVAAANGRPTYQQLREALDAKLMQQRSGADAKTLAKYGTPEVRFDAPPTIAPGGTAKASATCTLPKEGTLLVTRDDVALVSSKIADKRCEVVLKADDDAWPGAVSVEAVMPVSGRSNSFDAAHVAGKYEFELGLANGWTARIRTKGAVGLEPGQGEAQFFKPGQAKPFRTVGTTINASPTGFGFDLEPDASMYQAAEDDSEKVLAAAMPTPAEQKILDAASAKFQKCSEGPVNKLAECMEKPQKEMTAVYEAIRIRSEKAQADSPMGKARREFGCDHLEFGRDGSAESGLSGTVRNCEGVESQDLTKIVVKVLK